MVIAHESHVITRRHVDNMCNNVVLNLRSPHESTRSSYNCARRFLSGYSNLGESLSSTCAPPVNNCPNVAHPWTLSTRDPSMDIVDT